MEEIGIGIVGDERHLLFAPTLDDHYKWLQSFEEAKLEWVQAIEQHQRKILSQAVSRNVGRILFKRRDLPLESELKVWE